MFATHNGGFYAKLEPPAPLRDHVESIWVQDNRTDARNHPFPLTRVLPTGFVDVAFYYRDLFFQLLSGAEHRLHDVVVTGPLTRAQFFGATGTTGIILVRFRLGTAAGFLRCPLNEIKDRCVSLSDLLPPSSVQQVSEQLHETRDWEERVVTVGRFISRHVVQRHGNTVDSAIRQIVRSRGAITTSALARASNVGVRHLQRLFRDRVGITPKMLARLVRLHAALDLRRNNRSWTDTAYSLGYCDQAHLANDCRRLTGMAPNIVARRAGATALSRYFNDQPGRGGLCGTTYA